MSNLRNIQGVHQTKYYFGSVQKSKFSFSCHFQIDIKLNVKEDPRRKADINFNFSQATKCLWGFNKKEYYAVNINFFRPKEAEIGR